MRTESSLPIESLENRRLLAASALIAGGILQIRGDTNSSNTISVSNSPDGAKVNVSITAASGNLNQSFDKNKVKSVNILGGNQADTITMAAAFSIKTRIHGKDGNDTINAGNETDVIGGGMGNDRINANGGNDWVFGGKGNDTVTGGEGNDTLWGSKGDDSLEGGNGNDKLGGWWGTNIMHGNAGNDIFVTRTIGQNPVNDYKAGEDILRTPAGSDDADEPPAS